MAYSVHGSMVTQTPDEIRYEVVEDPREPGWILVLPLADLDAAWVESSTRGALDHGYDCAPLARTRHPTHPRNHHDH